MARVTHAQSIGEVAKTIGENLELVQVVTANSDNIVSVCWGPRVGYLDGVKFHGSRASRRLCGWPLAIAVRVAFR